MGIAALIVLSVLLLIAALINHCRQGLAIPRLVQVAGRRQGQVRHVPGP